MVNRGSVEGPRAPWRERGRPTKRDRVAVRPSPQMSTVAIVRAALPTKIFKLQANEPLRDAPDAGDFTNGYVEFRILRGRRRR